MKKKTYLLMALTMVSMGMNAQNSGNSSLEKGIEEFTKTMKIGGTIRSKYEYQTEEGRDDSRCVQPASTWLAM